MITRNYFVVFDLMTPPSILKILEPWLNQANLSMPIEDVPKIHNGYFSFAPKSSDGDPFDGELTVDCRYIVMHGCSPNNKLGFHYTEED
jgi:hypothetical protein